MNWGLLVKLQQVLFVRLCVPSSKTAFFEGLRSYLKSLHFAVMLLNNLQIGSSVSIVTTLRAKRQEKLGSVPCSEGEFCFRHWMQTGCAFHLALRPTATSGSTNS